MSLTTCSRWSMARTWWPRRSSSRATADPNRPSPITITCSRAISYLRSSVARSLADADRLDGRSIRHRPGARGEGDDEGQRAEAADEHGEDRDQPGDVAEPRRDPGAGADRAKGGDRLEQ